jgi:hypothetical protein
MKALPCKLFLSHEPAAALSLSLSPDLDFTVSSFPSFFFSSGFLGVLLYLVLPFLACNQLLLQTAGLADILQSSVAV